MNDSITENDNVTEIDLLEVLKMVLKRWWIILISAVICAVIGYVYSTVAVTPLYASETTFLVNPEFSNSQTTTITTAAQTVDYVNKSMKTYMNLLGNDEFYEMLESALDGKCSVDYNKQMLKRMIGYSSIDDTELFKVRVLSQNPEDAYIIVKEMEELAPERIAQIRGFEALKVVDHVLGPDDMVVNDSKTKNLVLAALVGIILSAALVVLVGMLDTRIFSESDIKKKYKYPVLGVIPNFDEAKNDNNKYTYNYGGKQNEKAQ